MQTSCSSFIARISLAPDLALEVMALYLTLCDRSTDLSP